MKLCIAGKNNIAVDCLLYAFTILDNHEICVVLNKDDELKNSWQKSLGFFAEKEGITVTNLDEVQKIRDIVFLSLEFDKIVNPELFDTKKLYNIHFSLLPEYKGMYTSMFPILHGKEYSGVTLHRINRGIDTGEIIEQEKIDIRKLNAYQLYWQYVKTGTDLVCKNMQQLLLDKIKSIPQSPLNSTYFSKHSFDFNNTNIDVRKTANQIENFVRSVTFRPYQMPQFNDRQISRVEITSRKSIDKPGTVVDESGQSIEISTIDYNVILYIDYFEELVRCSKENNVSRALEIINYISDINEFDQNGWTPLMIACYHASTDMFNLLIEFGADQMLTNYNGNSMLMYAKDGFLKSGRKSIIYALIDIGADIYYEDIWGNSVLDYLNTNPLKTDILVYYDKISRP